jgi:hypothetical protein
MTMKHVPGTIKDKYEILGVIGEGIDFSIFVIIMNLLIILKKVHMVWCSKLEKKY